jgi:DNA polymerase I-like protein with 3'-5' exonuclease and polymerase domains
MTPTIFDWELLKSDNYLVLDFETDTSGGHFGIAPIEENQLLLACWKTARSKTWSKWGGEYEQQELLDAIERADYIVAHRARYELGWLKRCGLDLRSVAVACTRLAEHVLLGNLGTGDKHNPPMGLSLNDCVTRRGGPPKDPAVDRLISDGINPVRIPRRWLKGRCIQDVETTEALWLDQRSTLIATNRLQILWTRSAVTTPVLADIGDVGMHLDVEKTHETYETYKKMLASLEEQMQDMIGGVNWRSPKQVADLLYGESNEDAKGRHLAALDQALKCQFGRGRKWPEARQFAPRMEGLGFVPPKDRHGNDVRTTEGKELDKLTARTKSQRDFLALRRETSKVGSALSKSLEFFEGVCVERNGHFLAELHQSRVATHRLSSTGIPMPFTMYDGDTKSAQFQNLPRVFKPLFVSGRGPEWYVGDWDGSQLEFRGAGHLSRDPQIKADILAGHDVHKFTGVWLYHAPKEWLKNIDANIEESLTRMHLVTKEQRQRSKEHTFKPVYGGRRGDNPRQTAYYAAFRARYHVLAQTQEGWVDEVMRRPDRGLTTEWGMQYYWPRARRSADGYVNVSNSIYNYPVQGFCTAEIIPIALNAFWRGIAARGLEKQIIIMNTVHDSVVCAVHCSAIDAFRQLAVDVWHVVYLYLMDVYRIEEFFIPLGTEVSIGHHWGAPLETWAYNVWPDERVELVKHETKEAA